MFSLFATLTCTQNPIHGTIKILYSNTHALHWNKSIRHSPNSPRNDTFERLSQIYPWVPSTLPSKIYITLLSAILKIFGLWHESLNLPVICSPSVNTAVGLVTPLHGLIAMLLCTRMCVYMCVGEGSRVCACVCLSVRLSKNIMQNVISTNLIYIQLDIHVVIRTHSLHVLGCSPLLTESIV